MEKGKNMTKINIIITTLFILAITMITMIQSVAAITKLPTNSCVECHRKLLFSSNQEKQFVDIRLRHIDSGISCSIDCHEDKVNKSIASSFALWSISIHSFYNVTCDKCHGGNPLATSKSDAHANLSNQSIVRENTPDTCGKCHISQLNEFKNSLHFKRLESEDIPAPACVTCHQAHSVHVLTASEIEDFCSNCHNNITGIDPTVPKRAENALSAVSELQVEFSKVRSTFSEKESNLSNVTGIESEMTSADTILKNIPSVWHRFDLNYFDTEIQQGINSTQNAERLLEQNNTATLPKKSPGFEYIILIIGLIFAYMILKR